MVGVGLDFSKPMLQAARERFVDDRRITLIEHDLAEPLPALGRFDAVVASFAIHHLEHEAEKARAEAERLYRAEYERAERIKSEAGSTIVDDLK